ncbi:MAG: DUF6188 family protein [Acidimicrobiales bacterium]|jgi:hypothetical protein
MIERDDGGFDLDELEGTSLTAICLMGLVRLEFDERLGVRLGPEAEIRVDLMRDFTVRSGEDRSGILVKFEPWTENWSPLGMTELASLFRAVVVSAGADSDGTLKIAFRGGSDIEVPPDVQYQGWKITGAGQWLDQWGPNLNYFPGRGTESNP